MRKGDRVRHIFFCLVCRITEHHALVTCADRFQLLVGHLVFLCFQRLVNAHRDVGGLLVDRNHNRAGIAVKAVLGLVVADFLYGVAHDFRDVHIRVGRDLACHKHKAGAACRLACHAAHRILCHQRIQDRVGNSVAHFVGMPFRYRFRSK